MSIKKLVAAPMARGAKPGERRGGLEAKKDDKETIKTAIMDAVSIASQVCNYRHPKLATVKVGGDRENPLLVREGVTRSR